MLLFSLIFGLVLLEIKPTLGIGSRIIGGSAANVGEFPFAAALHIRRAEGRVFCGGSIISTQWILTAAQCVEKATEATISIGSNHLEKEDPNRENLISTHFEIHPNYNSSTLENDVALIKLRSPITYTDYIKRTFLTTVDINDHASVVALGWGQIDNSHAAPVESLNFVHLTTLPQIDCERVYGNQVGKEMLCVAGQNTEGFCYGDSGTPLVLYLSANLNVQVGIATFLSGNGCENSDPSGYTRVFPYLGWIKQITGIE